MSDKPVALTFDIPASAPRGYSIWRPGPGQVLRVLVLSNRIVGCWTHFAGQTSTGCPGDPKFCFGCANKLPRRWRGYLACVNVKTQETGIVEITQGAANQWAERLQGGAPGLRGYGLTLRRRAAYARAPVVLEFSTTKAPEDSLPQPFNLEAALRAIWAGMSQTALKPTDPYDTDTI